MSRVLTATICLLLLASAPLSAATHIWRGTVSDRFSDPANWDGGSPAKDVDAELSFPSGSRLSAMNDLTNLTVRGLAFSASGYTISGSPIIVVDGRIADATEGPNTISSDLVLRGQVIAFTAGDIFRSEGLTVTGAISGDGGLTKFGSGRLTLAGTRPNIHRGVTHAAEGDLHFAKPPGIAAIGGDLRIGWSIPNAPLAYVGVKAAEQIPDGAAITVDGSGTLGVDGVETIGPLAIMGGRVEMSTQHAGFIQFTGKLVLTADVATRRYGSSARARGEMFLPATRTIVVADDAATEFEGFGGVPGAGLIIRGAGKPNDQDWTTIYGDYNGPTIVEGADVALLNPASAVVVRGGAFAGTAASIVMEGGSLRASTSKGDIRLTALAGVQMRINEGRFQPFELNGTLDLGSSTFTLLLNTEFKLGTVYTLISNKSTTPVVGTFAGLPEGAVIEDRYAISYRGGDGNDVTLTDVARLFTDITLTTTPSAAIDGDLVTITAQVVPIGQQPVAPTGAITFRQGTTTLATVPLTDGKASTTVRLGIGTHAFTVTYAGDARWRPAEKTLNKTVSSPKPVISGIEPSTVKGGTRVTLTILGSNFREGATVSDESTAMTVTFISPGELRCTYDVPPWESDVSQRVTVRQPIDRVASDPFTIRITAADALPPSDITFEARTAIARVTPGASVAWVTNFVEKGLYALLRDEDRDGVVRFDLPASVPLQIGNVATWVAVDMTTRTILAGRGGNSPRPRPARIPANTFVRDASGSLSHVVLDISRSAEIDLLLVRPGVGAWSYSASEATASDADSAGNGLVFFDVASMAPVGGSPSIQAVLPGDLFIGIAERSPIFSSSFWFGDVVETSIAEGPGALSFWPAVPAAKEENGLARFAVVRTGGSDGTVSVRYATRNGTAVAGRDYEAVAGTVTFGPGELVKFIDIPLIDDAAYSARATFDITLSDPVGAPLRTPVSRTVQMLEDEKVPLLTIDNVTVPERDSGTRDVTIHLVLSAPLENPLSIFWRPRNVIDSVVTEIRFNPGETRKTITRAVIGDTTPELDDEVGVSVFGPGSDFVTIVPGGSIKVIDDDVATISIDDLSVNENAGTVTLTLRLSEPSDKDVTVAWATSDGTATAGSDYQQRSGTVTFKGVRSFISIPLSDDAAFEQHEWFTVRLSSPKNVRLGRAAAVVTLVDNEARATFLQAVDTAVVEGSATTARFRITLAPVADREVSFLVTTVGGTAAAGADFQSVQRRVTVPAGQVETFVDVPIISDTLLEGPESFFLELSEPSNALVGRARAEGVITDDETAPRRRTARR